MKRHDLMAKKEKFEGDLKQLLADLYEDYISRLTKEKYATPIYCWSTELNRGFRIYDLTHDDQTALLRYLRTLYITTDHISITAYIKHVIFLLAVESNTLTVIKDLIRAKHADVEDEDYVESFDDWKELLLSLMDVYPFLAFDYVVSDCMSMQDFLAGTHHRKRTLLTFGGNNEEEGIVYDMPKKLPLTTLAGIQELDTYLRSQVIGQDKAIDSLIKNTKLVSSGLTKRASLFFLGPTGVGKTKLARVFAENFSGNMYKINCNEFISGHENNKLIGAPPGYIGADQGNILKTLAHKSNKWVFIFDEIEKAHSKFLDFIITWVEEGIVIDNQGNSLNFENSLFIFTSNCGVQDANVGTDRMSFGKEKTVTYEAAKDEIMKSVDKAFKPEFLNRIDDFIIFNSLTKEDLKKICEVEVKDIDIVLSPSAIDHIIENAYSPKFGARELNRYIKTNILLQLADQKLLGNHGKFNVVVEFGKLVLVPIDNPEQVLTATIEELKPKRTRKKKTND